MTIFRLDFWQEPTQFNPREYGPRCEWFDTETDATNRANQLRRKGITPVGPYLVEVAA